MGIEYRYNVKNPKSGNAMPWQRIGLTLSYAFSKI